MSLVVDASIAVRWFVESPGSSAAARLLEGDEVLLAPDLVVPEVVNVAWKLVRAGEISREHGARIAGAVGASFTRLVPAPQLAERAFALAVELDHPVYDCLYLALAERESCPLVTADRRLAAKAGEAMVRLVT